MKEAVEILHGLWNILPQLSFGAFVFLYFRMKKFEDRIDKKIDTKIDNLEEKLTRRIDKLEDRIFWIMMDKNAIHEEKLKEKK